MDGYKIPLVALTACASVMFGSDVGAHPIEGSVARPVPICAVDGWTPQNVGPLRPLAPPCVQGSRWYGPYGYICYRTRAAR